jgi:hypothetical protein
LVVDHLFEVMLDLMSEGSLVGVNTLFLRQQHRQQLGAARQTAHMCGQEAPFAAVHYLSSSLEPEFLIWIQPLCAGVDPNFRTRISIFNSGSQSHQH